MKLCGAEYRGPSFPEFRGTVCTKIAGHDWGPPDGDGAKHMATVNKTPLSWYDADQKAVRAREKAP